MCLRNLFLGVTALLLAAAPGCNNRSSERNSTPPEPMPLAPETVLRIHWAGKRNLALNGTAFYINRLWDLQESRLLDSRTLDRLAEAPWRLLQGEHFVPSAPVSQLRWVLESIKHEECFVEVRSATNSGVEFILAARVSNEHAAVWESNLAAVMSSLTGTAPLSNREGLAGWELVRPQGRADLRRNGRWTIFSISTRGDGLMREIGERINRYENPFEDVGTSLWLTAELDLNWISKKLGMIVGTQGLPRASIAVTGDGGNVLTEVVLHFAEPVPEFAGEWKIPTALISEPLTSFTAARGVSPWLSNLPAWDALHLGAAPDQLYSWSVAGNPFQVYVAVPASNASVRIDTLSEFLIKQVNPWLEKNGPRVNDGAVPLFENIPGANGIRWTIPGLMPFATAVTVSESGYLVAGLTPPQQQPGAATIRPEHLALIQSQTNLAYAEWEMTGTRINDWLPVLQTARLLAHHPALPEKSLSLVWLSAMQPRVGNTETTIARVNPTTLRVHRKSTLGLTAAELHLLSDWLESPKFPIGLHTFLVPPSEAPAK